MTNPFENTEGTYHVLVNSEGQHSLWPAFVAVPAGWTSVLAEDTRENCLDHIERHWTDMRPRGLTEVMGAARI